MIDKINKLNKENDSYYKEFQYQIPLKDTEINELKRIYLFNYKRAK